MSIIIIVPSFGLIVSFVFGKGNIEVRHVNHYITLSVRIGSSGVLPRRQHEERAQACALEAVNDRVEGLARPHLRLGLGRVRQVVAAHVHGFALRGQELLGDL